MSPLAADAQPVTEGDEPEADREDREGDQAIAPGEDCCVKGVPGAAVDGGQEQVERLKDESPQLGHRVDQVGGQP